MLTGHKKGSEHVGNLPVCNSTPVLVLLTTKRSHHIALILGTSQEWRATDEINELTILFSTLRFWMMLT